MAFEDISTRAVEHTVSAGQVVPESRFSFSSLMNGLGLRRSDQAAPASADTPAEPARSEASTTVNESNVRTLTTSNPDGTNVRVVQAPNGYRYASVGETGRVISSPIDPFDVQSFDTSTGAHIISGNKGTEVRPANALQWTKIQDGMVHSPTEYVAEKIVAGQGNPDFHRIILKPGDTFWSGEKYDRLSENGSLRTYLDFEQGGGNKEIVSQPDGSLTINHVARVRAGSRGGYQPTRYATDWSMKVEPTGDAKFSAFTDVLRPRADYDYPVPQLAGLDPARFPKGTIAETTISAAGKVDANFGPLANLRTTASMDESSGARLIITQTDKAIVQALDLTNGDRVMLMHPSAPERAIREGASGVEKLIAAISKPEGALRIVATDGLYVKDQITGPGHFITFNGAVKSDVGGTMLKDYLTKHAEVGRLLPYLEDAVGSVGRMLASSEARAVAATAIELVHI